MQLNRIAVGAVTALAATSVVLAGQPAQPAQAAQPARAAQVAEAALGKRSLAAVLAADGNRFDKNWRDFDITEKAVLAVLEAKPDSPVGLLADGSTRATAFLPTDSAFRRLVGDLAGRKPGSEYTTFQAVAGLGIDTVETVLLYHVVPRRTLVEEKVVAAKGSRVPTAAGLTVRVRINHEGVIRLADRDRDDENARVIPALLDLNRGNRQVAHGISQVLRPANL